MKTQEIQTYTDEDLQKDIIKGYLEKETGPWLEAKAKAERAGGLDAALNLEAGRLLGILDVMLEELIEIPGVRYE